MEQPHKSSSDKKRPKRKPTQKQAHYSINEFPDDILVEILSHLSRNEATKTSVLSRRWRYLWRSLTAGSLELDNRDMFSSSADFDQLSIWRKNILSNKIIDRVNHALDSHKHLSLDGLVIRFAYLRSLSKLRKQSICYIDEWIHFALQKEVKVFELRFSMHLEDYEFPSVEKLACNLKFGLFGSLRSMILAGVGIRDEVVQYFLASCPFLEKLCIRRSWSTVKLRVVDPLPPNLKVFEISDCKNISSLQVSATNLVSCTYRGGYSDLLLFDNNPNLSELTLGGYFAQSFIKNPNRYSPAIFFQLVKLTLELSFSMFGVDCEPSIYLPPMYSLKRLELNIKSPKSTHISSRLFTTLIEAAPLLKEFRTEMFNKIGCSWNMQLEHGDCEPRDYHKNLKAVEMSGYVGCSSDDTLVMRLLEIAPSIEMVTIDTEINYRKTELCSFGNRAENRIEAIERARKLSTSFPSNTVLFVT